MGSSQRVQVCPKIIAVIGGLGKYVQDYEVQADDIEVDAYFYCFNARFVWKFGGKHIQAQTHRVFSHHNETELSTQSCEPIADGEVDRWHFTGGGALLRFRPRDGYASSDAPNSTSAGWGLLVPERPEFP